MSRTKSWQHHPVFVFREAPSPRSFTVSITPRHHLSFYARPDRDFQSLYSRRFLLVSLACRWSLSMLSAQRYRPALPHEYTETSVRYRACHTLLRPEVLKWKAHFSRTRDAVSTSTKRSKLRLSFHNAPLNQRTHCGEARRSCRVCMEILAVYPPSRDKINWNHP